MIYNPHLSKTRSATDWKIGKATILLCTIPGEKLGLHSTSKLLCTEDTLLKISCKHKSWLSLVRAPRKHVLMLYK